MHIQAQSVALLLEKRIDLTKAREVVKKLKLEAIEGKGHLALPIGELLLIIFPNGTIRASLPGKSYEALNAALPSASLTIARVLEAIAKTFAIKEAGELPTRLKREVIDYSAIENIPYHDLRPKLGESPALTLLLSHFSALDVLNEFQVERVTTQIGETIGRQALWKTRPSTKAELFNAITAIGERIGLGFAKFEERGEYAFVANIDECYCAGIPNYGRAMCHIWRGLLRGALASFIKGENVSCEELSCWARGDTKCSFNVAIATL